MNVFAMLKMDLIKSQILLLICAHAKKDILFMKVSQNVFLILYLIMDLIVSLDKMSVLLNIYIVICQVEWLNIMKMVYLIVENLHYKYVIHQHGLN